MSGVLVCAGLNESAAAYRPAVTGGGGAGKMAAATGGVSEQKILDFQPSLRVLSSRGVYAI